MISSKPIVDIHIHSTLKPFGNSFYSNTNPIVFNDPSCIWTIDKVTETDKFFENLLGISRYKQSDFNSLSQGQIKLAVVALYPIEKQFVHLKNQNLKFAELFLAQFASLLGKKRIEVIISPDFNYFEDLNKEYNYLKILNKTPAVGSSKIYNLIGAKDDFTLNTNLLIVPSIEGCHCFCNGNDTQDLNNWEQLEERVATVKKWEYPPIYVTMAHHFYNGLCTHAKSLFETSGKLLDQKNGMRDYNFIPDDNFSPISDIGHKLIHLLLSNENGKRILIDVKHMSQEARNQYYKLIESDYSNKIPILWSHGAVNTEEPFEINLNFDDISIIYKTNGLIGIEIDQRILGYNKNRFSKWLSRIFSSQGKEAYEDAAYFWNQIQIIAEFAFRNQLADDLDPWKCICLGSDFDGVINPLNSYRDASSLSILYDNLVVHLMKYWETGKSVIPKNYQGRDANTVIYNILYNNAYTFIFNNYYIK